MLIARIARFPLLCNGSPATPRLRRPVKLRQRAAGFEKTLQSAEDQRPAASAAFEVFVFDGLGVELAHRKPHDVAQGVKLERDDRLRQIVSVFF